MIRNLAYLDQAVYIDGIMRALSLELWIGRWCRYFKSKHIACRLNGRNETFQKPKR